MSTDAPLQAECQLLARHLTGGGGAGPYVWEKYEAAHAVPGGPFGAPVDSFDSLLLRLARWHRLAFHVVDTHTAFFFPASIVRRKAILLLAILECSSPDYHLFDVPESPVRPWILWTAVKRAVAFAGSVVISVFLLLPLQIVWETARKIRGAR